MGVRGEGSGKKGGGKWGQTGREVVVRGREVGNAYPPTPPVHPLLICGQDFPPSLFTR